MLMMTMFRPNAGIAVAAVCAALLLGAGGVARAQSDGGSAPAGSATQAPGASSSSSSPAGTSVKPDATGPFVFASPPSAQANRIYSVNVRNGEVSACQFERPEGSVIGVTKCFPRDGSAAAGAAGSYDIVTTRYSGETGIFRVNAQTGEMSVCYVRDMPKEGGGVAPAVVCTPSTR